MDFVKKGREWKEGEGVDGGDEEMMMSRVYHSPTRLELIAWSLALLGRVIERFKTSCIAFRCARL